MSFLDRLLWLAFKRRPKGAGMCVLEKLIIGLGVAAIIGALAACALMAAALVA